MCARAGRVFVRGGFKRKFAEIVEMYINKRVVLCDFNGLRLYFIYLDQSLEDFKGNCILSVVSLGRINLRIKVYRNLCSVVVSG